MHDGVAKLQRWHERLAHTCPQHVMVMTDRALVEACHIGKQKAKHLSQLFDRDIKQKNQVMFADLLFPEAHNGTSFSVVLVIIDAFT
ncbi:hypothetical protein PHMEG_0007312 [Phytophthora megakarya]|uniref:Uncharacterized protein n=1 Tax=Phytophthora megakarya TaxID=4795 RepID=A0A225WMQ8_9STRA|nr:hypothetical protein PHMEG_0007312 [Phytophthora megakarya]